MIAFGKHEGDRWLLLTTGGKYTDAHYKAVEGKSRNTQLRRVLCKGVRFSPVDIAGVKKKLRQHNCRFRQHREICALATEGLTQSLGSTAEERCDVRLFFAWQST